jgi:ABC-type glycerol-3-phosphate transport system permease component
MSDTSLPWRLRVSYALKRFLLYAVLIFGVILVTFPFFWMILTSFKTYGEAIAVPPTWFPKAWTHRLGMIIYILRTHIGLFAVLVIWLGLGVFVAWRFVRRRWWRLLYILLHLLLFVFAWKLGAFGANLDLDLLWVQAAEALGYELRPLWENYIEAWSRAPFGRYFINSAIMSIATPLLILVTGVPAAYAFARMRFPGRNVIFILFLATMMIPQEVILIPNFITVSRLGWIDKFQALIIPWIVNVVTIFFLRQFFMSIPDDLFDAALLDGCGHFRFMIEIALPLSAPALVSTSLFNFLGSWNAVQWPLYVTNNPNMRPLMVGIKFFSSEAGMQVHLHNAAATFTTLPVIILFLFVQRRFIEGIARTGLR